jgi:hypothetical protein
MTIPLGRRAQRKEGFSFGDNIAGAQELVFAETAWLTRVNAPASRDRRMFC